MSDKESEEVNPYYEATDIYINSVKQIEEFNDEEQKAIVRSLIRIYTIHYNSRYD